MTELNTPHPDASRRFEEQAQEIRRSVVRFQEPTRTEAGAFMPNVYQGPPLTEEHLVGDPIIRYHASDGACVGVAIAEVGGTRHGLMGEGYRKLEALVRALAKTRPFVSTASAAFLENRIFDWATATAEQHPNCVEFVLDELRRAAAEHRVMVPISDLFVALPLQVGSVTITTFPESILQRLETLSVEEGRRMRADFQGLAVADVTVVAEPGRAHELALEQIALVVGIIRCFAPANIDPTVVSRIAEWGVAPQRTSVVFITDASGKLREFKMSLIDRSGKAVIDQEMWSVLLTVGLAELKEVIGREDRTGLEEVLLAGMVIFGRAALTPDLRERLIWYCAGLESLLLKDPSEPVLQNLSERLALFAYDTVGERAAAVTDMRHAYSLRSKFVHHGLGVENKDVVGRFARHGLRFFLRVAKNLETFTEKDALLNHIDRMKLSAP